MNKFIKSTEEFKQEVIDIVKSMPLTEILFIPHSYVEGAIGTWLAVNPDTGQSEAQKEYRTYYHMITSLPDHQVMIDIDLYMFRVARKIVDGLMLAMLDTHFSGTIFDHSDMSKDDQKYFVDLTQDILNRIEQSVDQTEFVSKMSSGKTTKQLRSDFNKYCEGVLND